VALVGDFAGLAELRRRVDEVAKKGVLDKLAKVMGETAVKLVQDEFKRSINPAGEPWAPVVRNRRKDRLARQRRARRGRAVRADKPLVDTGVLKGSISNQTTGRTVRIVLPVPYASFHQYGTKHIRRRQIVPEGSLPERFRTPLMRDATRVLRAALEGKTTEG